MRFPRGPATLFALATLAVAPSARADLAAGDTDVPDCSSSQFSPPNTTRVDGNTVYVCPKGPFDCGSKIPYDRQDESSGTTVEVKACTGGGDGGSPDAGTSSASSGCYVDTCVPPGTYRYGSSFSTLGCDCEGDLPYFTEVEVTSSLPAGCVSTAAATNVTPPWGNAGDVTNTRSCQDSGSCRMAPNGRVPYDVVAFGVGASALGYAISRRHRR